MAKKRFPGIYIQDHSIRSQKIFMEATDRIQLLLTRYRSKLITSAEFDELLVWMNGLTPEQSAQLAERHSDLWEQAKAGRLETTGENVDWDLMLRQVMKSPALHDQKPVRRIGLRIAAVAAVLAVVAGIYLLYDRSGKIPKRIPTAQTPVKPTEILPNTNQTTLILANGKQIVLDSAANGNLIADKPSLLVKLQDGEIAYRTPDDKTAPEYHTISVPRGGRPYRVFLADGSSVWLNAASSLRYPSYFNKENYSVELQGEGYFDINPGASVVDGPGSSLVDRASGRSPDHSVSTAKRSFPFVVRLPQMSVEVFGTQFNIMAYKDESSIQTTLLRGSVSITAGQDRRMLIPGHQARLSADGQLSVSTANTELATAWINGYFQFDKADVSSILRQVARWYDLDIEYSGKAPADLFSGKIERSLPLSGILKLLSSGQIRAEVRGRKLVVL